MLRKLALVAALATVALVYAEEANVIRTCLPDANCTAKRLTRLSKFLHTASDSPTSAILFGSSDSALTTSAFLAVKASPRVSVANLSALLTSPVEERSRLLLSTLRSALNRAEEPRTFIYRGLETLVGGDLDVLNVFLTVLDTTRPHVPDFAVNPDGNGPLPSGGHRFLFTYEAPATAKCVTGCKKDCDARGEVLKAWAASVPQTSKFNPNAFLGRIGEVIPIPSLAADVLAGITAAQQTISECGPASNNPFAFLKPYILQLSTCLYTYFSEPYDINNPADVAKYALPTTGEGDFIVEYLTIPWVFWLLLFLCFASVNVLSAYHNESGPTTFVVHHHVKNMPYSTEVKDVPPSEFIKRTTAPLFPKSPVATPVKSFSFHDDAPLATPPPAVSPLHTRAGSAVRGRKPAGTPSKTPTRSTSRKRSMSSKRA